MTLENCRVCRVAVTEDSRGKTSIISLVDDGAENPVPLIELTIAGDVAEAFPLGKRFAITVKEI